MVLHVGRDCAFLERRLAAAHLPEHETQHQFARCDAVGIVAAHNTGIIQELAIGIGVLAQLISGLADL